jgi:hypothetical protein
MPYSYGAEDFNFSLDLYTIVRTPWTSDRPVARPLPKYRKTQTQNKLTHTPNIHALSGIRTHDHNAPASENSSCLRSLGYRDRPLNSSYGNNLFILGIIRNVYSVHISQWTFSFSSKIHSRITINTRSNASIVT